MAGPVGDGAQHPLYEQVVDIDADVVMIEGQVRGSACLEVEHSLHVPQLGAPGAVRKAVEKQGPALLKEGEEGIPIRKDGLQRPGGEGAALPEQMRQALGQEARQPLPPVVSPQQEAQQVGGASDELGCEAEDVPQHEVPGRIVAQPVRAVAFLRSVERVEVAPVERRDDRVAEGGKQIVQPEGKAPAGLQQITGKRRRIAAVGAHDEFEARRPRPGPIETGTSIRSRSGTRRDLRR